MALAKTSKRAWSMEEDAALLGLTFTYRYNVQGQWAQIATHMLNRTGKQCRERYHNHLRPDIRKDEWTEREDEILEEQQSVLGNQWLSIARFLPGRGANCVKNRWYAEHKESEREREGRKREREGERMRQ
ncbi:Homeodomain-like protein, partial [Ochromonadaceae sp. CCMP2298]